MIAVLFNFGNLRLGEINVANDCRILKFGGGYFVRIDTMSPTESGVEGWTFVQSLIDVRSKLDKYKPRPAVEGDQVLPRNVFRVTAEKTVVDLVKVYDTALDCVRVWHKGNADKHPRFVGDWPRLLALAEALTGRKL